MEYPNTVITFPNASFTLTMEREFDAPSSKAWFREHWHHSIYYSLLYVLVIFSGQRFMSKRSAYSLRGPMAIWSTALAAFSILGASRMTPHILYVLRHHGVSAAICDNTFYYYVPTAYWSYAFTVSKLYELGDTAFIVARKQPLTFLHWYHHISVFMYCWQGYALDSPTGSPFGTMNYIVHSVMYSYYALKAMRLVRIPRQVSVAITLLQLLQMMTGVAITGAIYYHLRFGLPCSETPRVMYCAMVMYSSYLLLFLNFFYQTYFAKGRKKGGAAAVGGAEVNGKVPAVEKHQNGGVSNGTPPAQALNGKTSD